MKRLLQLFFFMILISASAYAQQSLVKGIIKDKQTGNPIPSVIVSLKGTSYQGTTDEKGSFQIKNVPYGSYTLEHNATGFTHDADSALKIIVKSPITDLGEKILSPALVNPEDQANIPTITLEDAEGRDGSTESVSGLLTASRDPFFSATIYTFSTARFRPRGYNNENLTLVNGIPLEDQVNSRSLFSTYSGLNDVVRSRENTYGLNASTYTFGSLDGSSSIDTKASRQRKQFQLSYAKSNRTYDDRLMATLGTGLMKGGWAFAGSLSRRWADQGYVKGSFYNGWSWFFSIEKHFGTDHTLSLTHIGANTQFGGVGPATQENYDLAGSNYYNPYWGYQNGKVRNSVVSTRQEPLTVLSHEWNISPKSSLQTSLGYQYGTSVRTALDWFNASDPRPDYYRRLPSFIDDPVLKAQADSLWRHDEAYRQVDWASLYSANTNPTNYSTIYNAGGIQGNNVSGQRSAYIIEDRVIESKRLNFNMIDNTTVSDHLVLTSGFNYQAQESEFYKRVNDLLGGDFYVDLNQFAEQDYPNNNAALQNNLLNPNRVLHVGDRYGYDYKATIKKSAAWVQGQFKFNRIDFFVAGQFSNTQFYRTGYVQNGIFQNNSLGQSATNNFNNYGIKGGATYKLDGRNYFFVNALMETRAPLFDNVYVSPRTRDSRIDNIQNEDITSIEGGYILRSPKLKIRSTLYYTQINNGSRVYNFYHEDYRTFVNYALTNIDRRHVGLEFGADANLGQGWGATTALSLGQFFYTSRQSGTITRDNSAEVIAQDETIYSKNFYVSNGPQNAMTLGLNYRSKKFWSVYLNANYFDQIWLDFNPARRTTQGVAPLNNDSPAWADIIDQKREPGQFTLDLFASKSWKLNNFFKGLKKNTFVLLNVGVSNILNNQNLVTGGFEQLRFDYAEKDVYKFAPKLYYGFGTTYFASLIFRLN